MFVRGCLLVFLVATTAHAGRLVRVAGGGTETENCAATSAKLTSPFGCDFDKAGNLYICEMTGERVLRVDPKGMLTILAGTGKKGSSGDGGPARMATFNGMHTLLVAPRPDGTGEVLYLADTWNNRVRLLDLKTGQIDALAGTGKKGFSGDGGPAAKAEFDELICLTRNFDGTKLYATDIRNRRIRAIDLKSGTVDTVAGNGKKGAPEEWADARTSPLVDPRGACVDRKGNLYILERSGHVLRAVDPSGKLRTVVGTGKAGLGLGGGEVKKAQLNGPKHLCVDKDDNVIIADTANHRILRYIPGKGKIELIAGTGKKGPSGDGGDALKTPLDEPHGVTVHREGEREVLYIVDSLNHRVFRLEE
ncbi:MAG: hypothetical protein U0793_09375 [Gemmataceae bacterium]